MNIEILVEEVIDALEERGHTEEEISQMSEAEVFSEYCNWHGLIGWAENLQFVMKNIESAGK